METLFLTEVKIFFQTAHKIFLNILECYFYAMNIHLRYINLIKFILNLNINSIFYILNAFLRKTVSIPP